MDEQMVFVKNKYTSSNAAANDNAESYTQRSDNRVIQIFKKQKLASPKRRLSLSIVEPLFLKHESQDQPIFKFNLQDLNTKQNTIEFNEIVQKTLNFLDPLNEQKFIDPPVVQTSKQLMIDESIISPQLSGQITPQMIEEINQINQIDEYNPARKKSIQRWKKLGNVFMSIHRLQVRCVENIDSPQKLQSDMNSFNVSIIKNSNNISEHQSMKEMVPLKGKHLAGNADIFYDCVTEMRKGELFTMLAERGGKHDLNQMNKLLLNDPKKYVRSTVDPQHMINKKNISNQNALYLAAKNGNTNILKFLVDNEADIHIQSQVCKNIFETPLSVAVRWSHTECVKHLLKNCQFKQSELRECLKLPANKDIQVLLQSNIKKKKFCFF